MKRCLLPMYACLLCPGLFAQDIDLKMLHNLLDLNPPKQERYLQKKGFRRDIGQNTSFVKTKMEKEVNILQRFQIAASESPTYLTYETNSEAEYAQLKNQIQSAGFYSANAHNQDSAFYQKKEWQLTCFQQKRDTILFYVIKATKKHIPKQKEILSAEDLLLLDSHEYLAQVFGKQNLEISTFNFNDTESKKCSVLFPNSNRQVIFIWKDSQNLKDILFILIGNQLANDKSVVSVELSHWISKQGVYCGMSLAELENLNKKPIWFYNWSSESAGVLAPGNTGEINFEKLKPIFNCLNCNFFYVQKEVELISSKHAREENQRVYVAGFALFPNEKTIKPQ